MSEREEMMRIYLELLKASTNASEYYFAACIAFVGSIFCLGDEKDIVEAVELLKVISIRVKERKGSIPPKDLILNA